MLRRADILQAVCPTCLADSGRWCANASGGRRSALHQARVNAARSDVIGIRAIPVAFESNRSRH